MTLTDDERAACKTALAKFIADCKAQTGVVNPVTLYSDAMFAAGIAYAQKWRSMESAPVDGTPVVLIGKLFGDPPDRIRACVSHYSAQKEQSPMYAVGWHFIAPGYAGLFEPTGWLPLPPTEVK